MCLVFQSLRNKSGNLEALLPFSGFFSARDDSSMSVFSAVVTFFAAVSVAHDAKFPRNVLPTVCMDGQLPTDDAVQACLTALNHGTPLPFNCTHMAHLVYSGAEPFASGTWKEAFRGQWHHHRPVVIKRNRRHQSSGRRNIVFEAIRMVLLQAPAHISLLGHCSVDGSLALNVVPAADPWPDIVDSAPWPLASRIGTALRFVDMVRWWRNSPFGPLVHCDLLPAQFGFLNDTPVLLDLDNLELAPFTNAHSACSMHAGHTDVCGHQCFKANLLGDGGGNDFANPLEAVCTDGRCNAFESEFNVWTLCRVLLSRLLQDVAERDWLHRCTHRDPRRRLSLDGLAQELQTMQAALAMAR